MKSSLLMITLPSLGFDGVGVGGGYGYGEITSVPVAVVGMELFHWSEAEKVMLSPVKLP